MHRFCNFISDSFSRFQPQLSVEKAELHTQLPICTANCKRGHPGLRKSGDCSALLLSSCLVFVSVHVGGGRLVVLSSDSRSQHSRVLFPAGPLIQR